MPDENKAFSQLYEELATELDLIWVEGQPVEFFNQERADRIAYQFGLANTAALAKIAVASPSEKPKLESELQRLSQGVLAALKKIDEVLKNKPTGTKPKWPFMMAVHIGHSSEPTD